MRVSELKESVAFCLWYEETKLKFEILQARGCKFVCMDVHTDACIAPDGDIIGRSEYDTDLIIESYAAWIRKCDVGGVDELESSHTTAV
jgi:hypothetical protein